MAKEICRYGIMSNDKSHIKCKKCDSICVYSRYCTACGKVIMIEDYNNKCKILCSKKGDERVENINPINEVIKNEEIIVSETVTLEEQVQKEEIEKMVNDDVVEEVKKPKKNKKEKSKVETCEIIKRGKDYVIINFKGANLKFNTTKQYKKNKVEIEYTSELGKKDFTIKLK